MLAMYTILSHLKFPTIKKGGGGGGGGGGSHFKLLKTGGSCLLIYSVLMV